MLLYVLNQTYLKFLLILGGWILMQGFLTFQSTNLNDKFLFIGNQMKAPIEGMGTYRLVLDTGCHLALLQTLYVPLLSRNVVLCIET